MKYLNNKYVYCTYNYSLFITDIQNAEQFKPCDKNV